jgi:dTDP-glucose 4,6-dehydratase
MYPIGNIHDQIMQEDIEYLLDHFDFSKLYNSAIIVSGATGFIGSQLVKILTSINLSKNANITIYALIRDTKKAKTIFQEIYEHKNLCFITHDICQKLTLNRHIDYIIHCASITASRTFIENPIMTIDTSYMGTRAILDLARENHVKGLVYLSSMEVFGIPDNRLLDIKENDYGYSDILNYRSSYSECKRMCECLCACYAQEYGLPIKIARLTQVVGAGINYYDTRVAAQFARSVIENKDIILKTHGKTLRPLVYTRDAITGIFTILLKGVNGQAYTVANKTTAVSIREIAEMVVDKIANKRIRIIYDINIPAEYVPNIDLCLNLNVDRLESLMWRAEVGLEDSYRRMIESMRIRKLYDQ